MKEGLQPPGSTPSRPGERSGPDLQTWLGTVDDELTSGPSIAGTGRVKALETWFDRAQAEIPVRRPAPDPTIFEGEGAGALEEWLDSPEGAYAPRREAPTGPPPIELSNHVEVVEHISETAPVGQRLTHAIRTLASLEGSLEQFGQGLDEMERVYSRILDQHLSGPSTSRERGQRDVFAVIVANPTIAALPIVEVCPPRGVVRAPRYQVALPVLYRWSGDSRWHSGTTENLSRSGILFHLQERSIEVGEEHSQPAVLDLSLQLPRSESGAARPAVRCCGTVVRVKAPDASWLPPTVAVAVDRYRLAA